MKFTVKGSWEKAAVVEGVERRWRRSQWRVTAVGKLRRGRGEEEEEEEEGKVPVVVLVVVLVVALALVLVLATVLVLAKGLEKAAAAEEEEEEIQKRVVELEEEVLLTICYHLKWIHVEEEE